MTGAMDARAAARPAGSARLRADRGPVLRWTALVLTVLLVAAAMLVPRLLHLEVHAAKLPPLMADWHPHFGPGSVPAIGIAIAVVAVGPRLAARLRWRPLLLGSFLVALAWIVALALSEWNGISRVFPNRSQYLRQAREVGDVGAMLQGFVDRIPLDVYGHWAVNVAGHPPGAFLFFVLLVRIGLGSGLASGLVVIVLAATTPAAVLITLRRLGAEPAARRVAPLLAVGPSAVWLGVSADAMFAAAAAWGLCALAVAATARRRIPRAVWAAVAGLVLGFCVFLSYGLVLLVVLALGVLVAARSWRPLPVAVVAAVAVALAFAAAGFAWWEAYPVLVDRYWDGFAAVRPAAYWWWADLALLAIATGPLIGPGVATAFARVTAWRTLAADRAVVVLTIAAAVVIVVADASGLSKAEVERIWLPFVPWLLISGALLPSRWRRFGLAGGVLTGLAVELLLHTAW